MRHDNHVLRRVCNHVRRRTTDHEEGQILLLGLGYVVVILLLVMVVVTLSAVHREHRELGRLADAVALAASDTSVAAEYYQWGSGERTANAQRAATDFMAAVNVPRGTVLEQFSVAPSGTVTVVLSRQTRHRVMVTVGKAVGGTAQLTAVGTATPVSSADNP
ncbi:pilus assembly protein TadG-related protein [Jonesia quinghaiensis]|uniref:pilus assembly protein TadG-related protein n=1 Tax=Jonesia quinghaiensis TaxID=262806 RepID=UPI0004116B3C|nr:pilus assembly protein TadG-related protein [Jonesia quinghaiensis]